MMVYPVDVVANPPKPSWGVRGRQFIHDVVKSRWAYAFIAPFFILYSVFGFFPQLFSIYLSLSQWKGLGPVKFVGLANYKLIFSDKVFWQAMSNSVIIFFMYVPIMLFLALVLAVLLTSRRIRGAHFFRLMVFLPYITNRIASGRTFQLLFNSTNQGLINYFLHVFGLGPVPWMDNVWTARITLSLLIIWGWVGYNMILMMAGLQTINPELNEAALIDGATPVQAFFRITVPLMRPIILFCLAMSVMGTFNLFAEIYSLTNAGGNAPGAVGGPMNATVTPLIYIYAKAFGDFRMGYAAALSYVYFLFIFIVTLVQFRRYGNVES
jgi:lactose/L-arabinose transport system permease protein